MAQSEVGPNDIVIHLVNPYKCGDCGSEFCLRSLFLEHLGEHIELLKTSTPCHQIVCVTSLVEQQAGGITVTRDILQINEQQMFELQDVSMDYTQLMPLKALEQAGILNLPRPLRIPGPVQPKPLPRENPLILDVRDVRDDGRKISLLKNQPLQPDGPGLHVQILNTSHNKMNLEPNQINVQHIEASNPCLSELDTIVQQAFFGDSKFKGECRIAISSPVELSNCQSLTEVIDPDSESAEFEGLDNKSILGRGKIFPSTKGKGNKQGVACLICSNVFANSSVLERHLVVHTGAKPYSCNICFKEFNDVSSHRKHSLIHRRQHRCPVCHRMYLRRTQLLLHMKQHKKKRFIQFGNNFHEVQVSVTRNMEGQLVQEYYLPLLSALDGSNKNFDISKVEDQTVIKQEFNDSPSGMKASTTQTQDSDDTAISNVAGALGNDSSLISCAIQGEGHLEPEQKKKIIYRCGHCKVLVFSRPTLSRHLIKHTNTRPFQCEKCLKCFHDKADLLHHHKTHTKPVQCKMCLSSFSKVLYLQNHLLKGCPVTESDSRFTLLPDLRCQCNFCQKILKNKANILRHLRIHAFQDRNKPSDQAEGEVTIVPENLQSSDLENLSQNVEDHFHPLLNSVGYHCLICGQEFRFKSFIITHVRMHLNQRPYQCPDCPKSFYARQMLKKHQQNHTRPYKCPACNKTFIRRYLMKDHFKKRHEQEDPLKDITELLDEKLIQCDICGKTMKSFQKSVMLSHIRLHKDVRPYECKVCHKSFISDNALRKHSLNHTKPYKCNMCNRGFSRRYLLTDHFKKKCARKKKGNPQQNGVLVQNLESLKSQNIEVSADGQSSTVDASTECEPYEAKIITKHDPENGSTTYTCEPCDKRFKVYDALMRHINTFSKATPCKYCKQIFEDKHLTLSHQRSCLGPSLSPVQKCSKKSKELGEQQEKIQKIMKSISQKIGTLTSETSSEPITDRLGENSENNTVLSITSDHHTVGNLSGDSLGESLSTPVTRTVQILKETKGSFCCPECDKSFNTPRGLKIHASSHVRLFKCEVCDKDFTQITQLRTHAKVHKNGMDIGSKSDIISLKPPKKHMKRERRDMSHDENECDRGTAKLQKVEQSSWKRRSRKDSVSDDDKGSEDDCVAEMKVEHMNLEEVTQRLMQSGTRGRPYSCKMCRRRFTEQSGLEAHMQQNHGVKS